MEFENPNPLGSGSDGCAIMDLTSAKQPHKHVISQIKDKKETVLLEPSEGLSSSMPLSVKRLCTETTAAQIEITDQVQALEISHQGLFHRSGGMMSSQVAPSPLQSKKDL